VTLWIGICFHFGWLSQVKVRHQARQAFLIAAQIAAKRKGKHQMEW